MRYENRWEREGRRAMGAKTGCAPRHAGKWCRVRGLAVLAASRRESRREASPRSGCGRVVIVYSSLFRRAFTAPVGALCCYVTTIVSGKVVRTQKYQTLLAFFFFFLRRRRVRQRDDARDDTCKGVAADTHETRVYAAKTAYFSLSRFFLQFTPVSTGFNWKRNALQNRKRSRNDGLGTWKDIASTIARVFLSVKR